MATRKSTQNVAKTPTVEDLGVKAAVRRRLQQFMAERRELSLEAAAIKERERKLNSDIATFLDRHGIEGSIRNEYGTLKTYWGTNRYIKREALLEYGVATSVIDAATSVSEFFVVAWQERKG